MVSILTDKLLKISEVAEQLGFSASTVRNLCNSGRLKCVHPTGSSHRKIFQSLLDEYLESLKDEPDNEKLKRFVKPVPTFKPREIPAVFDRLGVGNRLRTQCRLSSFTCGCHSLNRIHQMIMLFGQMAVMTFNHRD